jgi:hypothetical protein
MKFKLFLLLAFPSFGLAGVTDCVPMRWPSGDPKTLQVLSGGPVSCLLLERSQWSKPFVEAAAKIHIQTLGVVRRPGDLNDAVPAAVGFGIAGLVLAGEFDSGEIEAASKTLPVVLLTSRRRMLEPSTAEVIGTAEAVWPGIRVLSADGSASAGPSSAPWIDTNSGFIRFIRSLNSQPVWIANLPPEKRVFTPEHYLAAITDAASMGAQWIVALDDDLQSRLAAREDKALVAWNRICDYLHFFDQQKELTHLLWPSELLVVEDAKDGALLTGGLLDMVESRHTPFRVTTSSRLKPEDLRNTRIVVDMEGPRLPEEKRGLLIPPAQGGPVVISPPMNWQLPPMPGFVLSLNQLAKSDLAEFESVWDRISIATGRKNLGVRVFNGAGMLSSVQAPPNRERLVVTLINYTGYPVESITVYFPDSRKRVTMLTPEGNPKALKTYPLEDQDGSGVEIVRMDRVAILIAE